MIRLFLFAALMVAAVAVSPGTGRAQDDGYVFLFNGKNLDGWQQAGGNAKYSVQDGIVIGESVADTPNSFLCTQKLYHNFVLKYEYKCDEMLNSGVQFRSNVYAIETAASSEGKNKMIPAGRVHGYQVEIDPNKWDRMWSAGVYDEGRRGWLFPGIRGGDEAAFTKQGQQFYKPGAWNSVKVECNGNRIRTWLNDQLRADFEDDLTPKGLIALQVHGVGQREEAVGKTVMWRSIRIKELP